MEAINILQWGFPVLSIAILVVAWWLLNGRLKRQRLNDQLELGKMEAERLKALDLIKSDFFSNVTHEFRTPLTLILGHLEQVIPNIGDEQAKKELIVVKRNAKILEKLINQLLDIAKIEANKMDIDLRRGNIVPFVNEIQKSFVSLSLRKGVALKFHADEESINMDFDPDKVELIFFNLLSNAFKFTDNGEVNLRIGLAQKDGKDCCKLVVQDTGIGIVEEQIDKVFDRFYQSENSRWRKNKGTGIGLALVKDLVNLHKGDIDLKSISGVGTEITILLPLEQVASETESEMEVPALDPVDPDLEVPVEFDPQTQVLSEEEISAQNIVLIIEDNDDIRNFLRLTLEPSYRVFEAVDGETGIAKATEIIPDIIICDIMMPGKDGFEVTKVLKKQEKTSHVPIVLLTAKAGVENRITGLETGADGYIPKPFSSEELHARITNLIGGRKKLKEKFSRALTIKPEVAIEPSMEQKFLLRVKGVVDQFLGDENFSVEQLSKEVGMSRAQLHRKLIALTGVSASRFVRNYRLEHAHQLLQNKVGTVSEIAYRVGYSSPAYFTKCFTEDYGISPSQVKKEI
ncbi:MAG: signal transduction histidine kinase/DNA-binding response OmpR family regulator [Bacteroidia bacterium]|jgi:signal transduction histidine kinase/DNA-binding response OmpR family regulator